MIVNLFFIGSVYYAKTIVYYIIFSLIIYINIFKTGISFNLIQLLRVNILKINRVQGNNYFIWILQLKIFLISLYFVFILFYFIFRSIKYFGCFSIAYSLLNLMKID